MTPKQHRTRTGDRTAARARRQVAEKYLEIAELLTSDDGASVNVCIGNAILAGIAAGDAICLASIGERYADQDHNAAAEALRRVDAELGKALRELVALKAASHYGEKLLSVGDRHVAMRRAAFLVGAALDRTR